MKILIIPSSFVDYLQDAIYIGFKDRFGRDVESLSDCSYLHKNVPISKYHMWGMGFSYTNILDEDTNVVASNVMEKIESKYYDLILYTMVPRNPWQIDKVMEITNGKNVFLINGLDEDWNFYYHNDKSLYFKRELVNTGKKNIFPVHYAIHKSKLIHDKVIKTQELSDSIPSMDNLTSISSSHYIFDNETDYYRNYQKSKFGITKRKGGWDSMRHYEILANKCVPIFEDLENCPELTLTNLPKKLLIEIKKNYYSNNITDAQYESYQNELFEYTKEFLTTDSLCDYILKFY